MRRILFFAAPLFTPLAAEARDPTPEMRARIEAALREQGYTAWDDIDVERDGRIEVDDRGGPTARSTTSSSTPRPCG